MSIQSAAAKSTLAAAEFLAAQGLFGLVWFGENLVVSSRIGPLANIAVIGEPVTETVLALFGHEQDILDLRNNPGANVHIPNVAIATDESERQRLDVHVYWHADRRKFLLLLARAPSQHTIETQLYEENRRRRLAEETIVQQAAELQRTNAELSRANRDLSEFAYVISHDLNAPLRALRYHAEDLAGELRANTDQATARLLNGITFQSRRMSTMLTDLLAYSRIGRKEESGTNVDTANLLVEIIQSLPRPASISVAHTGDWPNVKTYAAPLDLVLRNLIHNAIKHHDREAGCISVHCTPAKGGLAITVTDDGPGIDPRYHEAVFQPFCKLSLGDDDSWTIDDNAEASGIGLALVRRTAENIGARLELVSDPRLQRGTTFRIFWPIQPHSQ